MLRENDSVIRQLMVIVDAIIITSAFFIAYHFRNFLTFHQEFLPLAPAEGNIVVLYPIDAYLGLLPMIVFPWIVSLYLLGNYQSIRLKSIWELIGGISLASLVALTVFASIAYLSKFHYLSRTLIVLIFAIAFFLLLIERCIIAVSLYYLRKKGYNTRYLVLIGTGKRAMAFLERIHKHPEWGFTVNGLIDNDPSLVGTKVMGHKVIGTLIDLPHLFEHMIVDEVIVAVPRTWLHQIESTILYCEQLGKRVSIATDLYTLPIARMKQGMFHGIPILMIQSTPDKVWSLTLKRFLDITLSFFSLILLIIPFCLIAILIKLSSKGPIFFKQIRSGLNGRKFVIYKFRTMVVNAEAKLEELKKYNEMSGPVFKMTHDPRIIRFGKWMRKFSIDEFPQLFNVLIGDMSIVGPRPPIPSEVKRYYPWQRRRLSMRPGITCLWQVEGRNRITSFDEWMKLDLKYIDHWSLGLDLKICLKTFPVVVLGIGAK